MAIGTGTAIAIAAGASLVGGLASSAIGADAARDAAREQRKALRSAQDLQREFYGKAEQYQTPFLQAGNQAFGTLNDLINQELTRGPESLNVLTNPQGYQTQQFNLKDLYSDPGIQFAQNQAQRSVQSSAAAKGGVLGASTLKELQDRAFGLSGQQVNDAFGRFQGQQQLNLAGRQQQLGAEQQSFGQNLTSLQNKNLMRQQVLDRLSGIAQLGPQTATALGNQAIGQGGTLGNLATQLGNVSAAERVAQGQAYANAASQGANTLGQLALLGSLYGKGAQ